MPVTNLAPFSWPWAASTFHEAAGSRSLPPSEQRRGGRGKKKWCRRYSYPCPCPKQLYSYHHYYHDNHVCYRYYHCQEMVQVPLGAPRGAGHEAGAPAALALRAHEAGHLQGLPARIPALGVSVAATLPVHRGFPINSDFEILSFWILSLRIDRDRKLRFPAGLRPCVLPWPVCDVAPVPPLARAPCSRHAASSSPCREAAQPLPLRSIRKPRISESKFLGNSLWT